MVGAVALAPYAVAVGGDTLLEPDVLAIMLAVGLLSSVVPYSFELVALRTLQPRVLGILMSLEPAAAALVGMVLLRAADPREWLAIACVVAASVGVTRTAGPPAPVPD